MILVSATIHLAGSPVSFPGERSWTVTYCLLNQQSVNFTARNFQCVKRAWWRSSPEWLCWGWQPCWVSGGCAAAGWPPALQRHLSLLWLPAGSFACFIPCTFISLQPLNPSVESYMIWINVFYGLTLNKMNCDTAQCMRDGKDRQLETGKCMWLWKEFCIVYLRKGGQLFFINVLFGR